MSNKELQLVSSDHELRKKLEDTGLFEKVTLESSMGSVNTPYLLLVSDKLISCNELQEWLETQNNAIPHIFYMLSNDKLGNVRLRTQVLRTKGVKCISPQKTTQQIIEQICVEAGLYVAKSKNIFAFLGADSKVGTTITTQAIAELLALCTKSKIALMYLNGEPSTEYLPEAKSGMNGIESIKAKVINKILSEGELMEAYIKRDNLYIMPGATTLVDTRYYSNEHIENLIQLASKAFDVVIIDAGCKVFNGMTIGALNTTPHRYLITTQQEAALKNYERTCEQVFAEIDISPDEFLLIINKYIDIADLHTASQLATLYKTTFVGTVPYVDYGWQAEKEEKTLLNYDCASYRKQITQLVKIIAVQNGIEFKFPSETKRGIFSRILH